MRERRAFCFGEFEEASEYQKNRTVAEWLGHDGDRSALYRHLQARGDAPWPFPSRAHIEVDLAPPLDVAPKQGHADDVYLVHSRADIEYILANTHGEFSNEPYRMLGNGSFMLGMDPGGTPDWHAVQRACAETLLNARHLDTLVQEAIHQAGVLSLSQPRFDAAEFGEQCALRFCALLFGFSITDHALMEAALRAGYRALTYINLGRHFISDPLSIESGKPLLARLLARADELMAEFDRLDRYPEHVDNEFDPKPWRNDWPAGVVAPSEWGMSDFQPLLKRLAKLQLQRPSARSPGGADIQGRERAMMVVGLLTGIVGNVQASVCIAVDRILRTPGARLRPGADEKAHRRDLAQLVARALNENPPVPFLPRVARRGPVTLPSGVLPADAQCILCIGAATDHARDTVDPLVWGAAGVHSCIGAHLALPLVQGIVETICAQPGLAESLDMSSGDPHGLSKRWGFACTRYPLEYRRDQRIRQQPLQVIMRIKSPVSENAAKLKQMIREGAPSIQRALDEARHVHFAWFQLVNDETQLALQTVYDGDFDAYIEHFALKVDEVFDLLFQHIEDAPPLPVRHFPQAFIETIRRFNRAPLGGYFYSAYPGHEVPEIVRHLP